MVRGIFLLRAGAAALTLALALALAATAHAAGNEDADAASGARPENYVALDNLTATVARDYRIRGVLHIEAGLEIGDADLRARALALMPRLRDAYATTLADYAGTAHVAGRAPDAGRIGDMLQAATDRTLGRPGADFLLGMVIVH